jgi:hypothetical protein
MQTGRAEPSPRLDVAIAPSSGVPRARPPGTRAARAETKPRLDGTITLCLTGRLRRSLAPQLPPVAQFAVCAPVACRTVLSRLVTGMGSDGCTGSVRSSRGGHQERQVAW